MSKKKENNSQTNSSVRERIAEDCQNNEDMVEATAGSQYSHKELNSRFRELYLERSSDDTEKYGTYWQMVKSCYTDAGYKVKNDNGVMYHARKCLERNWEDIEIALRSNLNGGVPIAIQTLTYLCANAKAESVRAKCADLILNKSGFGETHKIEITRPEEMEDKQLEEQIKEQMAKEGLRLVASGDE